jgi:hypothetical protein
MPSAGISRKKSGEVAVRTVSRVAVLWDATIGGVQFHATEMAARSAGVVVQSIPIRRPEDVNEAFERTVREQAQAMVILSSPLIFVERAHIAQSSFEKSAADDQSFQFVS